MIVKKMNFMTLGGLVPDKATSIQFLHQLGLLYQQRLCPNGHLMVLQFRIRVVDGDVIFVVAELRLPFEGFERSRLPLRNIILFMYYWSRDFYNIEFMQHEVGIGRERAIQFNNYLREVCAADLLAHQVIIRSPITIVEDDESLFSRRKAHQGRILPQQWVFGGICREIGECFMPSLPDRYAATLLPIIQGSIRPCTSIMSDMCRAYGSIAAMGYQHLTVNHQMNFGDPQTGAHTQNIERSWKATKERNKRQNGTHRTMLDSYLCEWMRRKRHQNMDLFDQILSDIAAYWSPQ